MVTDNNLSGGNNTLTMLFIVWLLEEEAGKLGNADGGGGGCGCERVSEQMGAEDQSFQALFDRGASKVCGGSF